MEKTGKLAGSDNRATEAASLRTIAELVQKRLAAGFRGAVPYGLSSPPDEPVFIPGSDCAPVSITPH
jgi:hypothetical protein